MEKVESRALLVEIKKKARSWLAGQARTPGEHPCPVCEAAHEPTILLNALDTRLTLASAEEAEIVAKRDDLKSRYNEACRLNLELNQFIDAGTLAQQNLASLSSKVLTFLGSQANEEQISIALSRELALLNARSLGLEEELLEIANNHQKRKRDLDLLKDEVRFHSLQDQIRKTTGMVQQLSRIQDDFRSLALFGDSVKAIIEALKTALIDALKWRFRTLATTSA